MKNIILSAALVLSLAGSALALGSSDFVLPKDANSLITDKIDVVGANAGIVTGDTPTSNQADLQTQPKLFKSGKGVLFDLVADIGTYGTDKVWCIDAATAPSAAAMDTPANASYNLIALVYRKTSDAAKFEPKAPVSFYDGLVCKSSNEGAFFPIFRGAFE